jgi:hypothetical protein
VIRPGTLEIHPGAAEEESIFADDGRVHERRLGRRPESINLVDKSAMHTATSRLQTIA